ncbi:hypothetical protein Avbf_09742 [Armadillidium vulgare]|nr:hypothetical protein Avbf_09742 [Armadillidium vulgare]
MIPKFGYSRDQVTKLKAEIQKKDEELTKLKSQDEGLVAKLQSELEAKNQELQKANSAHIQYKEKVSSELSEINKKLDCAVSLVKVQKLSPTGIIEKPSLDTPPTANIKPMAAPIPTSAVPTARSQGSSQGSGSSRSIPTASIKPMATTSTPTSQTSPSVVAVSPMEAHSGGDGAVSSTVTIPQATVTRTPVAAASTTTQAFPPSLTATVSPTPVSQSSIVSTAPFTQPNVASVLPRQDEHSEAGVTPTPSGSADSIVSQAIALVAPQIEERSSGSQKRKLESVLEREEEEEEELEDAKRTRLLHEESLVEEEDDDEGMEDDEEEEDEDDMGEPSSSSHQDERKIEKEIVLSSDEENDVPPSQSGREEEDQEENANEGGREAEAERNEEGESSSATPSSSLQPPPRPLHEPPSSSSRQSLAPFHQLPNYEEGGDDRMVPSTPTFVPRPCEGQSGDGVSSPQVPSQGFEFGASSGEGGPDGAAPSSDGLSQIAEGGVSIDATRMDLAQLDDATHSSIPSVPIQSFPTEQSAEGNISSSGGDGVGTVEVSQGQSSPLNPLEVADDQIERGDDVVSSQEDVEPEIESQELLEEDSQSPPSSGTDRRRN